MDEKEYKVCPECGISLETTDPVGHSLSHWTEYLDPAKSSVEARKRQKLTLAGGVTEKEYQKMHEVK